MSNAMKHFFIIFLISFIPILSFGQNAYFSIDSSTSVGIKLIDNGDLINSRLCQVKKGESKINYTPYEVDEYGFKDGRIYISKEIQIADSSKRVFLERLHNGKTTLFYYRGKGIKTFFLENDSATLVELPKQDAAKEHYSELLANFTDDCPNVSDACKLVSYNKRSLSKLIKRYNKCESKPFPHFKYGFIIGYEFSKLVPSEKQNDGFEYVIQNKESGLDYFDYNYDSDFSVGVFIDHPILVSDFSVHVELLFSKHGYSYEYTSEARDLDLIINVSTLKVPLLVRYSLPKNNFRPYFNAGPVYSYNLKNEGFLYESSVSENGIEIKDLFEGSIIPKNEIGYAVGCGLKYDLDFKRAVFLEIRYSQQFGISDVFSNKNTMINISAGINF